LESKQVPLDASGFIRGGRPRGPITDDKEENGREDTPLPHFRGRWKLLNLNKVARCTVSNATAKVNEVIKLKVCSTLSTAR